MNSRKLNLVSFMVALFAIIPLIGCAKHERVDVDSEDTLLGGMSSKDFRDCCFKMAGEMIAIPKIQKAKNPPNIVVYKMENKSDELIDTESFLDKMSTELVKNSEGKVQFLDRKMFKQILDEKTMKEGGIVVSERTEKQALGADYFLTGMISGNTRARGKESTTYLRISFRLTDAQTSVEVWKDDYEVKYYHKSGVYDR